MSLLKPPAPTAEELEAAEVMAEFVKLEGTSKHYQLTPADRVTNCGRCGRLLIAAGTAGAGPGSGRHGRRAVPPAVAGYVPDPTIPGHRKPACKDCHLRVTGGVAGSLVARLAAAGRGA